MASKTCDSFATLCAIFFSAVFFTPVRLASVPSGMPARKWSTRTYEIRSFVNAK